jgi:hypothetical protein
MSVYRASLNKLLLTLFEILLVSSWAKGSCSLLAWHGLPHLLQQSRGVCGAYSSIAACCLKRGAAGAEESVPRVQCQARVIEVSICGKVVLQAAIMLHE